MKKLLTKIKESVINFLKWLWMECKDWRTLVLFVLICLFLSTPIWLGYIIGFLFKWEWAFWVASLIWGIWMLPGAPFFALAVSITLAIKKLYERSQEKKAERKNKKSSSEEEKKL
ncbi:MAG: hypothetical protein E7641_05945 [Ruminococcaceae bacterium]|nr:hypothetical protein [Oscillospiraceae bacterium]